MLVSTTRKVIVPTFFQGQPLTPESYEDSITGFPGPEEGRVRGPYRRNIGLQAALSLSPHSLVMDEGLSSGQGANSSGSVSQSPGSMSCCSRGRSFILSEVRKKWHLVRKVRWFSGWWIFILFSLYLIEMSILLKFCLGTNGRTVSETNIARKENL